MKTNGMFQPAPMPGKPALPAVPALIVGAFAITTQKQARGTRYDVNHIPTGTYMFNAMSERGVMAGVEAIADLLDWASIKTPEDFARVPASTRQRMFTAWSDAVSPFVKRF